jgi:hypothetical protein
VTMELTAMNALAIFVLAIVAGAGWALGAAIMGALIGALRRT